MSATQMSLLGGGGGGISGVHLELLEKRPRKPVVTPIQILPQVHKPKRFLVKT